MTTAHLMGWSEIVKRSKIEEQNRFLLKRQHEFRMAADVVTDAWTTFAEVQAVAVIGSVAKALWKEVPRFREFRRTGMKFGMNAAISTWLCGWTRSSGSTNCAAPPVALCDQRSRRGRASASSIISSMSFLIEPGTDRYLGRLCSFSQCPKGKRDCLVPGCGTVAFNKRVEGFVPHADLLAPAHHAMLYERGAGRLRSAIDLPTVEQDRAHHEL